MIDYFALLKQPRRPWLDPEELKQTYQQLTLSSHPDRPGHRRTQAVSTLADINEAYRVLTNPKLRLQHLLSLEGHPPIANTSVPGELLELFSRTGTLLQEIDLVLKDLKGANNALAKSLLRSEVLAIQARTNALLGELEKIYESSVEELRQLNKSWDEGSGEVVEQVVTFSNRVAYLGRWIDQLRERQFQLSLL